MGKYDPLWRIYKAYGTLHFLDGFLATNRKHADIKTSTRRHQYYQEAMAVVRRHYGSVPLKWWLAQPYTVWYRSLLGR